MLPASNSSTNEKVQHFLMTSPCNFSGNDNPVTRNFSSWKNEERRQPQCEIPGRNSSSLNSNMDRSRVVGGINENSRTSDRVEIIDITSEAQGVDLPVTFSSVIDEQQQQVVLNPPGLSFDMNQHQHWRPENAFEQQMSSILENLNSTNGFFIGNKHFGFQLPEEVPNIKIQLNKEKQNRKSIDLNNKMDSHMPQLSHEASQQKSVDFRTSSKYVQGAPHIPEMGLPKATFSQKYCNSESSLIIENRNHNVPCSSGPGLVSVINKGPSSVTSKDGFLVSVKIDSEIDPRLTLNRKRPYHPPMNSRVLEGSDYYQDPKKSKPIKTQKTSFKLNKNDYNMRPIIFDKTRVVSGAETYQIKINNAKKQDPVLQPRGNSFRSRKDRFISTPQSIKKKVEKEDFSAIERPGTVNKARFSFDGRINLERCISPARSTASTISTVSRKPSRESSLAPKSKEVTKQSDHQSHRKKLPHQENRSNHSKSEKTSLGSPNKSGLNAKTDNICISKFTSSIDDNIGNSGTINPAFNNCTAQIPQQMQLLQFPSSGSQLADVAESVDKFTATDDKPLDESVMTVAFNPYSQNEIVEPQTRSNKPRRAKRHKKSSFSSKELQTRKKLQLQKESVEIKKKTKVDYTEILPRKVLPQRACRKPQGPSIQKKEDRNSREEGSKVRTRGESPIQRQLGKEAQRKNRNRGRPRVWSNTDLIEALRNVWTKKMNYTQASQKFGIPYHSLYNYVKGKSLKLDILKKELDEEMENSQNAAISNSSSSPQSCWNNNSVSSTINSKPINSSTINNDNFLSSSSDKGLTHTTNQHHDGVADTLSLHENSPTRIFLSEIEINDVPLCDFKFNMKNYEDQETEIGQEEIPEIFYPNPQNVKTEPNIFYNSTDVFIVPIIESVYTLNSDYTNEFQ